MATEGGLGWRGVRALCVLAVCLLAAASSPAQQRQRDDELAGFIRSHYTKHEYRVPMRDGVALYTAVYVPNDHGTTYPFLMLRTPYSCGPYGADHYPDQLGPTKEFAAEGYIFVCQDVRGRFMSEGEFVNMRPHLEGRRSPGDIDESTDTYDTIEWLLEHVEGNNGRVGQWGNSYPGFYTSAGAIDSHPALVAVSPNAPIADWFFDDMHHHGAFTLSLSFPFFAWFGRPHPAPTTEWPNHFDFGTPDGYQFFLDLGSVANVDRDLLKGDVAFWTAMARHPDYDSFWRSRNILPHLKHIGAAVMTVGGWFDAEDLYGSLHTYQAVEAQNPGIFNVLVMGPWRHGGWLWQDGRTLGDADFGFATAEAFRARAMVPFFRHYLKGEGDLQLPEAWMFETGADRWREFAHWPPVGLERRSLYLRQGGALAPDPPTSNDATGFDEFPSDPAKPVPYTETVTTHWHAEYMVEDQRFAAHRPDVLVFRSPPLEEDLTVAGPLAAHLWVSTTARDADWVVKLIDEYPGRLPGHDPDGQKPDMGGTQRMVRSEIFRGRYRASYARPEPFEPAKITEVVIPLQDVLHTFRRGHRVMVQVQSSLFPLFDRNPQSWVANIFQATSADFVKATHRVWHSSAHPSSLELGVLPAIAPVVEPVGETAD